MAVNFTNEQFMEIQVRKSETHIMFVKQILLMASAIFGILVSMHKPEDDGPAIVYAVAISFLSAGILLLCIGLYAHVDSQIKLVKSMAKAMINQMEGKSPGSVVSAPLKIYKTCERLSYFFLSAAVIGLAIYSLISNFRF